MSNFWQPQIPGYSGEAVSTETLKSWANSGSIKPDTQIKEVQTGRIYPASQIPGIFSDKSLVAAALLSFFLGGLGVDRFYLGYTGIGIAKLVTLGGLGVWSLIDFILILVRQVPDSQGRALL
jgi:hypothetical protein